MKYLNCSAQQPRSSLNIYTDDLVYGILPTKDGREQTEELKSEITRRNKKKKKFFEPVSTHRTFSNQRYNGLIAVRLYRKLMKMKARVFRFWDGSAGHSKHPYCMLRP